MNETRSAWSPFSPAPPRSSRSPLARARGTAWNPSPRTRSRRTSVISRATSWKAGPWGRGASSWPPATTRTTSGRWAWSRRSREATARPSRSRARGPTPQASLEIAGPGVSLAPALWDEFVIRTEREDSPAEAAGELVYVGYLVQAPERQWDDLKGMDLAGKVLLVEVNEPGNRPGGVFDGEDMTYYGRWPYKYEKATELGAAGVLIIHDTKGAAYGWDVLRASWANESFFDPDRDPRLLFEGWIGGETADRVLAAAKLDRRALREKAETPEFAPVPLGLKATVRQRRVYRTVDGVNVAGIVRAKHPAARKRMIVFSAHYDHFGRDETLEGDQIYNGAVDNCSASAALLATAGYYAQRPEKLKDDLCFVAVTAEEQLVLGSAYFARHLPFDKSLAIADINYEMTNVWGETEDVFAIGARHSDLDAVCREAAGKMGLRYIPERNGELGFFYRSDQISFARDGIPGVWLSQGVVARGPDKGLVQRKFEDYRRTKYHKVTDEMEPDWDLRATLQIVDWAKGSSPFSRSARICRSSSRRARSSVRP